MYDYLVKKTIALLAPSLGCRQGDATYDKLWYGIYVFYLNAAKTLLLIAIALMLGILPYVTVFALAYGWLRIYSFGVHLHSTFACTMVGLVYYLGSTYLSLYVTIPLMVKAVMLLVCMWIFIVYAPAQTKKRPIPEQQRKALKVKSLRTFAIITIAVFIFQQYPIYSNLLYMAVVCQSANILPITYKIFKGC